MGLTAFFLTLSRGILSSQNPLKMCAVNYIMRTTVHKETSAGFPMILEASHASITLSENANTPAKSAVFLTKRR